MQLNRLFGQGASLTKVQPVPLAPGEADGAGDPEATGDPDGAPEADGVALDAGCALGEADGAVVAD
jgi:hypothetical protein